MGMFRRPLFTVYCLLFTVLLLAACGGDDAVPEEDDIIFSDQFIPGETGDWLVEGDDVGQTAVIDQKLIISIDQPNTLQYTTLTEPVLNNFSLEVDAQQIAGNPESSYGILARMRGADQFYRFEITSSGLYMAERHNADGSWSQYLEDWTESPAIKQGLNTVNRLKVVANGPNLSFYVNDTLLHEAYDNGVGLEANIGLDAGTFGQTGLQVAFDNVVIRERPLAAGE
ncbi:MAG: hypothetical protein GWP17_03435 [Aquificales bacterium]|nr:hypothetical protein [Aquificales bacterium]